MSVSCEKTLWRWSGDLHLTSRVSLSGKRRRSGDSKTRLHQKGTSGLHNNLPRPISGCAVCRVGDDQSGLTHVPTSHLLCIILNHWLLVYSCLLRRFYFDSPSKMVAIRRSPGPPPQFNSEDSESSATATSSSKAKALHHASHSPDQSSPLANGKSREDSHDSIREDGSRDTVRVVPPLRLYP